MFEHATRAASYGAKWMAIVTLFLSLALIGLLAAHAALGDGQLSPWYNIIAAVGGAIVALFVGAIIFFAAGLLVSLLHIKPVGWSFFYALFGGILTTLSVAGALQMSEQPLDWFSAISLLVIVGAAVIGTTTGFLVARAMKTDPRQS
jgi:hypothetical protein